MILRLQHRPAFILLGLLAAGFAGEAQGRPGPLLGADGPPAPRTALAEKFEAVMAAHEEDGRRWSRALDDARTEEERATVPKVDDEARAREALALVKAAPEDPAALEICCRIAIRFAFTDAAGLAMARIRESHLADPRLGEYLPGLALSVAPGAEGVLRAVRDGHEDATVRDRAALALARNLLDHALTGHARIRKEGENLINDFLGPDEEAKLVEEVEGICEMVRDRRADSPWVDESGDEPAPTTMGKQAAAILDALGEVDVRRLAAGRPAPEIVAADGDGKSSRLSESRGKVVLLSFGGQHCVPCRGMILHERELQARLAERSSGSTAATPRRPRT